MHALSTTFRTDIPPYTDPPPEPFNVVARTNFVTPFMEQPDFQDFLNLETASRLSEFDLPIGQVFFTGRARHFAEGVQSRNIFFAGHDPTNYMGYDRMLRMIESKSVGNHYLNELQTQLMRVAALRSDSANGKSKKLSGALNVYDAAMDLGWFNPMFVVMLMSLIELLIVPKNSMQSITNEIKRTMPSRGKTFRCALDHDQFAPATPIDVWDAFYELRSCLAHGRMIDFTRRKLSCLKSKEAAIEFIIEGAKGVLLQEIDR